jgi:hypothetical protein
MIGYTVLGSNSATVLSLVSKGQQTFPAATGSATLCDRLSSLVREKVSNIIALLA